MSGKIPRIVMREAFGFHVLEEDWCEIEKRYAHSIPAEARSAVNDVTEKYLRLASAEQDAPSKADALKRLEDLKGRTASLKEAINELPADNPIREYVDEQIAFAYSISKYEDSTSILEYLSTFERELERFSKACQDTITFLSNNEFWPAGGAWHRDVVQRRRADQGQRAGGRPHNLYAWGRQTGGRRGNRDR